MTPPPALQTVQLEQITHSDSVEPGNPSRLGMKRSVFPKRPANEFMRDRIEKQYDPVVLILRRDIAQIFGAVFEPCLRMQEDQIDFANRAVALFG